MTFPLVVEIYAVFDGYENQPPFDIKTAYNHSDFDFIKNTYQAPKYRLKYDGEPTQGTSINISGNVSGSNIHSSHSSNSSQQKTINKPAKTATTTKIIIGILIATAGGILTYYIVEMLNK